MQGPSKYFEENKGAKKTAFYSAFLLLYDILALTFECEK